MLPPRTQFTLRIVSLLTAIIGCINLLSAVTPSLPERVVDLEGLFPFEVRAGARLFAAVSGFLLLTLAANLLRRKRVAWLVTSILLAVSALSHLLKGLDYEESLIATLLLGMLIWMRPIFTAQSDRPSIAEGIRILLIALLFTLAYGTIGFYLLDFHYSVNFDLKSAIAQTLAMFFTEDNAGLQPITRFGKFFANSIGAIGAITIGYALLMILRPVLLPASSAEDRLRAEKIVEQYGNSSLARFTLLEDKTYFFSPTGQSVIAYVAKGRGAIALGDPIGPVEDLRSTIQSFQDFCLRNDWYPAFYQTLPDHLDLYTSLGFRALKIGEEGIVNLKTFTLEGKAGRNLRPALNKLRKHGFTVEFHAPPVSDALLEELRPVSDEWLHRMQGSEKKFSLGWFNKDYLKDCEIAVVRTPTGSISAFTNIITEYQCNDITIDLMRSCNEVEPGTMDFLFISLFQHCKQAGYDGFNLGLSALSGLGDAPDAPRLEKAMRFLSTHLNRFYHFRGLHAYKAKFNPRWEPRYLIYPSLAALPEVVIALVRADSGDRLLDYFKLS